MEALKSYGITDQASGSDPFKIHLEEIAIRGYSVIENVISEPELVLIRKKLDEVYSKQESEIRDTVNLADIQEKDVARMLFAYDEYFLKLLAHPVVLDYVKEIVGSYFNIQLQNGIINMPQKEHHQSSWHRDLPYQNFTSSKPLALNALFCIDEFFPENGSTFVLPYSHHIEKAPSVTYFKNYGEAVKAPAGSVIIMDSMLFHKAGYNSTSGIRRAINQVYIAGIIKQQMDIPAMMANKNISDSQLRMILGLDSPLATSVSEYRIARTKKMKK